eukprot:TRINITY_DN18748_c0_g1_i1.p1 TRINITY_DN18748_c0_g1~~TRINITY_DN18748_c0_g1_i1.p1  ORF type:complete len:506 (+),score=123.12 TRINITY_DN18748_c0_g1_i1:51-1568(+)
MPRARRSGARAHATKRAAMAACGEDAAWLPEATFPPDLALRQVWADGDLCTVDAAGVRWHRCFPQVAGTNGVRRVCFHVPEHYTDVCWLAAGGQGALCSATDTRSNARVAIKMLGCHDRPVLVLREVRAMRAWRSHANLARATEIWGASHSGGLWVYLAMPLMSGSMYDWLGSFHAAAAGRAPPPDTVRMVGYQVLRGLRYLHAGGAMHRDVATKNILWEPVPDGQQVLPPPATPGSEAAAPAAAAGGTPDAEQGNAAGPSCGVPLRLRVAVADFGLTRSDAAGDDPSAAPLTDQVVTMYYRAPELIVGQGLGRYDAAVDIWALGLCIAEMVNTKKRLQPVLQGATDQKQLDLIMLLVGIPDPDGVRVLCTEQVIGYLERAKTIEQAPGGKRRGTNFRAFFDAASDDCIEALRAMLVFDPRQRPSAEDLMKLEFFRRGAELCGEDPSLAPLPSEQFDDGVPPQLLTPRGRPEAAADCAERHERIRQLIVADIARPGSAAAGGAPG